MKTLNDGVYFMHSDLWYFMEKQIEMNEMKWKSHMKSKSVGIKFFKLKSHFIVFI